MMDVLHSAEVTEVFEEHALNINDPFSKDVLDKAVSSASEYTETRQSQKGALSELSKHSLFKRHVEPTTSAILPSEIALRVRENKLTGPRVERALRDMYQEGLQGEAKYSAENCREMAQQFINYANKNHRDFNMSGVKSFLNEMSEAIKERQVNIDVSFRS
jgi:hypothetical protein